MRLAELYARHAVRHLARHELDAAQRALVVEEDAGRRVEAKALAIVHRDPVAVELCDGVGAARIEGRRLGLRRLLDAAVHFGRGGLVEARVGLRRAHGLQHVRHADGGDGAGEDRLLPGGGDEALRGEIVDLVGFRLLHDARQARQVGHIAVDETHVVGDAEPAQAVVLDAAVGGPPDDTKDLVALAQQEFRQIGPVLTGDARQERTLAHSQPFSQPWRRVWQRGRLSKGAGGGQTLSRWGG